MFIWNCSWSYDRYQTPVAFLVLTSSSRPSVSLPGSSILFREKDLYVSWSTIITIIVRIIQHHLQEDTHLLSVREEKREENQATGKRNKKRKYKLNQLHHPPWFLLCFYWHEFFLLPWHPSHPFVVAADTTRPSFCHFMFVPALKEIPLQLSSKLDIKMWVNKTISSFLTKNKDKKI